MPSLAEAAENLCHKHENSTSQDDNADIVEKAPSGGDEPVLMGDDSVSLEVLAFASFVVNSCALFLCRRFRV